MEAKKRAKPAPRAVAKKKRITKTLTEPTAEKSKPATEVISSSLPTSLDLPDSTADRLDFSFYDCECEELSKKLLGQELVRVVDGVELTGVIVETEAYCGLEDKAAHSYGGKRTEKTEAMFMPPGTSYVYYIYGSYCCFNVSSRGEGCAVLVRALEPRQGQMQMTAHRMAGRKSGAMLKPKELCNGPSKLCSALKITKPLFNKTDLCTSDTLYIRSTPEMTSQTVVTCPRIGINYAGDWVSKPLRFYVLGNIHVSQRDKQAEEELKTIADDSS